MEIDSGRYVDYIEMDAASYRGVDEMVDLLERAAYAPSTGRYKVYMIDEVHQLSNHAFNAMLKTLEEPPAHIMFVLATTDPQKVPVTVLSRCLQFNLKQLPASEIAAHLGRMLEAEQVKSEEGALRLIANAGRGSMRDAQSLLDQAIAYSGGEVNEAAVRAMLGTVDDSFLYAILEGLAAGDGKAMLAVATDMDARSISFDSALQELASLLHLVALAQTSPQAPAAVAGRVDAARVAKLALALGPEDVQLYYQIAIHGRQDLPLAPDEYAGFTMALLRMLAFRPSDAGGDKPGATASIRRQSPGPVAPHSAAPADKPAASAAKPAVPAAVSEPVRFDGDWPGLARRLKVSGIAQQLARQSELKHFDGKVMDLAVPPAARHLAEKAYQEKLAAALAAYFGAPIRLNITVGETTGDTVQDRAVASINQDGFVRELLEQLDATIVETSIQPEQAQKRSES
jgi:DNA polymerase-3 subunit gamma/tau